MSSNYNNPNIKSLLGFVEHSSFAEEDERFIDNNEFINYEKKFSHKPNVPENKVQEAYTKYAVINSTNKECMFVGERENCLHFCLNLISNGESADNFFVAKEVKLVIDFLE